MKIIFITGKGGVGKSVVAAATALNLARKGKRTLLVELGNKSFYKDFFDLPQVEYNPLELQKNFFVCMWSGKEALKEYAKHLLKIDSLYKLFFENKVSKTLVEVAPGLSELSIVGKITSGPPRNVGPKLDFDYLVIDAYSTGHFIALLKAPEGMANAVRFGPMGEQSREILNILKDKNICSYNIVSIAEELPITEAKELALKILEQTNIKPVHLLNKCLELDSLKEIENKEFSFLEFKNYISAKNEEQTKSIKQLNEDHYDVLKIPWVFSHHPWKLIEEMSLKLNEIHH